MRVSYAEIIIRNDELSDRSSILITPPFSADIENNMGSVCGTDDEDMFLPVSSNKSILNSVENN